MEIGHCLSVYFPFLFLFPLFSIPVNHTSWKTTVRSLLLSLVHKRLTSVSNSLLGLLGVQLPLKCQANCSIYYPTYLVCNVWCYWPFVSLDILFSYLSVFFLSLLEVSFSLYPINADVPPNSVLPLSLDKLILNDVYNCWSLIGIVNMENN